MRYWPGVTLAGPWSLVAYVGRINLGGSLLGFRSGVVSYLGATLAWVGADTVLTLTTNSGDCVLTFVGTKPTAATLTISVASGTAVTAQLGEVVATGTLLDSLNFTGQVTLGYDPFTQTEGDFDLFDLRVYNKVLPQSALTGWREDLDQSKFLLMPMR